MSRGHAMTGETSAPPPPLVKATKHPLQWSRNQITTVVMIAVFAHVGMVVMIALYYLGFEVIHPITRLWHSLVPNRTLRHDIRDVGEGLLGSFVAQQMVWNHYKKRKTTLSRIDSVELALHIPNLNQDRPLSKLQLATSPLIALSYAIPGFVIMLLIAEGVHLNAAHLHGLVAIKPHTAILNSAWDHFRNWWAGSWDKKLIGYGASFFFGRRPMRRVFDDVQLWFAQRRVAAGKDLRIWHSPTYQARYHDLQRSMT
jgi:hypothetical protein